MKRLLLLSVCVGVAWGFASSSYFRVETVTVATPDKAQAAYITQYIQLPAGATTLTYPLSRVAEAAERCPLVRSAVASRHLPRTIIVTPVLREPMCAVEETDGFMVLDSEGVAFGKYPQRPASVPLVRGIAPVPDKCGVRVHPWYAGTLATCTSAMRSAGMAGDYAVDVTNRHLIAVYMPSGLECKIGETDSLARKVALCARIIADLRQKGEQAEYIDVRVPERPVWKPRGATTIADPSTPADDATKPVKATKPAHASAKPSDQKPKHAAAKPKKPKAAPKHPAKAQDDDDDLGD